MCKQIGHPSFDWKLNYHDEQMNGFGVCGRKRGGGEQLK